MTPRFPLAGASDWLLARVGKLEKESVLGRFSCLPLIRLGSAVGQSAMAGSPDSYGLLLGVRQRKEIKIIHCFWLFQLYTYS